MVMMMILGATFYGSSSMLKFVNQSRGRKFHTAAARVMNEGTATQSHSGTCESSQSRDPPKL